MKLTALFTTQWGWEGCNYQFNFLQPTHSLFGYFNPSWWVDQYTKIIQPNKEMLEQLKSPMTSLQNFARIRVNIFGTETDKEWRKCEEAMEKEKPKEREVVVWDGHTASKANTCNTHFLPTSILTNKCCYSSCKRSWPVSSLSFLQHGVCNWSDCKLAGKQCYWSWDWPRRHSPTPCHTSSCPRFSTCSASICKPRHVFDGYSLIWSAKLSLFLIYH